MMRHCELSPHLTYNCDTDPCPECKGYECITCGGVLDQCSCDAFEICAQCGHTMDKCDCDFQDQPEPTQDAVLQASMKLRRALRYRNNAR